jgi:hypothetical protein
MKISPVVVFSFDTLTFIVPQTVLTLFLQNVPFMKFHPLILVLARDIMKLCQKSAGKPI